MSSLISIRKGSAAIAAALLIAAPGALSAQARAQATPTPASTPMPGSAPTPVPQAQTTQPLQSQPTGAVISARAGQRSAMSPPAPDKEGVHLSLTDAIRLALANNQDLNVTVNVAESAHFFLFQNTGIYDPLLTGNGLRSHQELPTSSQLSGGTVIKTDVASGVAQVSQLTPWGGVFSLGFSGDRTKTSSSFQTINPAFGSNLVLGVSQPLLRNFGVDVTNLNINTARNTRDASYQNFVRSVQTTIDTVEQAYWDLVFARANLLVKLEARDIAAELNRITKIKIDVGSMAPIDIVQTEVGIATAEQDVINAEAAIGLAGDQLRRAMNYEATSGQTPIVPTDALGAERLSFDLGQGVETALDRRPEILAQGYAVASDQLVYDYWGNQILPRLDLQAHYGHNGGATAVIDPDTGQVISKNDAGFDGSVSSLFTRHYQDWSVGLVFSYPILNRTARGARGVAEFNMEADRARLTTLQQDIVLNVRNAHRAIVTAALQIDAAAKSRELAERNLDAARKKYDNGMTTSFEVSQIQAQLSDAKSKELLALAIYRKAVSAYHSAVADILDWKGVKIEGIPDTAPPQIEGNAQAARRVAEGILGAP
jgi:outer membrane protein